MSWYVKSPYPSRGKWHIATGEVDGVEPVTPLCGRTTNRFPYVRDPERPQHHDPERFRRDFVCAYCKREDDR